MASKRQKPHKTGRKVAAKSASKQAARKSASRKRGSSGAAARRGAAKKSSAKKAGAKKRGAVRAATKTVPCVDGTTAVTAVDGCDLKLTGSVHSADTKLGDLFPTATTLNIFRRCVADATGVSGFPCGPDNTKQDVEIGLTCQ